MSAFPRNLFLVVQTKQVIIQRTVAGTHFRDMYLLLI